MCKRTHSVLIIGILLVATSALATGAFADCEETTLDRRCRLTDTSAPMPQADTKHSKRGMRGMHGMHGMHDKHGGNGHKGAMPGHHNSKMAAGHSMYAAQLMAYEHLRHALANDALKPARAAAANLAGSAWHGKMGKQPAAIAVTQHSRMVASAKSLAAARKGFGHISRSLITLLAASKGGAPGLQTYKCPMAAGYGKWLQPKGSMSNPYMGKKMAKCGMKKKLAP